LIEKILCGHGHGALSERFASQFQRPIQHALWGIEMRGKTDATTAQGANDALFLQEMVASAGVIAGKPERDTAIVAVIP